MSLISTTDACAELVSFCIFCSVNAITNCSRLMRQFQPKLFYVLLLLDIDSLIETFGVWVILFRYLWSLISYWLQPCSDAYSALYIICIYAFWNLTVSKPNFELKIMSRCNGRRASWILNLRWTTVSWNDHLVTCTIRDNPREFENLWAINCNDYKYLFSHNRFANLRCHSKIIWKK